MLHVSIGIHPAIERLQNLLKKIDCLRLPAPSRRDVESILVRQVAGEIGRCLPGQRGHGDRTATVAVRIGIAAGLRAEELHDLRLSAYLHDIGLLAVPHTFAAALRDPDSYAAVQAHPRLGAQILEPFGFLQRAALFIAHHHERWDGTSYPYGIRGQFIPLEARILAVADAFDSITVPNVREPRLRDIIAARIITVAAGTQFDPEIVRLFAKRWMGERQSTEGAQPESGIESCALRFCGGSLSSF